MWTPEADDRRPARPPAERLRVGEGGDLQLTEAQRRRWGASPGVEFTVQETPYGLVLRRADPALARVYVEPTTACNLSCRTCVRQSWLEPEGLMAMGTYHRLLASLATVPTLRALSFWGYGEPLLHPEIVEMVRLAGELGAQTDVVSNGLLLDRHLASGLVEAGLDRLVVSVDGVSEEAYADVRIGGDLRRLQENLEVLQDVRRAARRRNPELGIEFVAMRRNIAQLGQLRRLAERVGANLVIVTNLLPHSKELNDEILYPLWGARSYPLVRTPWTPEIRLPRIDARGETLGALLQLLKYEGLATPTGWDGTTQGYCRFVGEGAAAVGWDGEVSPCVALMHSYTCYVLGREKRIRRYGLGNVQELDIGRIWERDEFARFRERVRRFDFAPCSDCGGCELADTNEEDCFGNPFPVCGDCLWAKGAIQCP